MSRTLSILFGPELYWIVLVAVVSSMASRNIPPTPEGNYSLERLWLLLPFIAMPVPFALIAVPALRGWQLLARLDLAAVVGFTACALVCSRAIDYGNSRKSGSTGFVLSVSYGIGVLFLANVASAPYIFLTMRRI